MNKEDMKIYDIVIDDETKDLGLNFISLVDRPAVEIDFLKFAEEKEYQKFDMLEDEKIVFGVIMLADTPIYRKNKVKGEHYIVFSKDTIKKIIMKYFKESKISEVNLEHETEVDGVYLFQSFIIDRALGLNPPTSFKDIPDGSWVGAFKVDNEAVWSAIKEGKFNGFSVEGFFGYGDEVELVEEPKEEDELLSALETIHNDLAKIK